MLRDLPVTILALVLAAVIAIVIWLFAIPAAFLGWLSVKRRQQR